MGIDLGQTQLQATVAGAGQDVAGWRTWPQVQVTGRPDTAAVVAQVRAWVVQQTGPEARCRAVVVEATGSLSRRFARAWAAAGGQPGVTIVNPARPRALARALGWRDKTDRQDAALLAVYGLTPAVRPPGPRRPVEERLAELTRLRATYVAAQTEWGNRWREVDTAEARACIEQTRQHLQAGVATVDAAIAAVVASDTELTAQVTALCQIPGIKQVVATTLTAELGDLRRYTRRHLVARAGLYPRQYVSGTSVWRRPRLAKGGGAPVRRVLYLAATAVLRSRGPLRAYADRLRHRGLPPMVFLGALMRKLLLIARAVMQHQGVYDATHIGCTT